MEELSLKVFIKNYLINSIKKLPSNIPINNNINNNNNNNLIIDFYDSDNNLFRININLKNKIHIFSYSLKQQESCHQII
jgi:hypothetical protein